MPHHQSPPGGYSWPPPPDLPSRHPDSHKYNPYPTPCHPPAEASESRDGTGDGAKQIKQERAEAPKDLSLKALKTEPTAQNDTDDKPADEKPSENQTGSKLPIQSAEPNAQVVDKSKGMENMADHVSRLVG